MNIGPLRFVKLHLPPLLARFAKYPDTPQTVDGSGPMLIHQMFDDSLNFVRVVSVEVSESRVDPLPIVTDMERCV